MKPISYREQNSCTICKFAFKKFDVGGHEYFCNINNDRPSPCGSWINKEMFYGVENEQFKQMDTWDVWAKDNYVEQNGICDNFANGKQ